MIHQPKRYQIARSTVQQNNIITAYIENHESNSINIVVDFKAKIGKKGEEEEEVETGETTSDRCS